MKEHNKAVYCQQPGLEHSLKNLEHSIKVHENSRTFHQKIADLEVFMLCVSGLSVCRQAQGYAGEVLF